MKFKQATVWLFLIFAVISSSYVSAACWAITDRDGITVVADDFWNLSNKLEHASQGFLIGRVDGDDTQISVEQIRRIEFNSGNQKGWRGWLKNRHTHAKLTFVDGSHGALDMDLNIFYRTRGKKQNLPASTVLTDNPDSQDMNLNIFYRGKGERKEIPVVDIASIERCNEQAMEAAAPAVVVKQLQTTKTARQDTMKLIGDEKISGQVTTSPIRWKTAYGVLEIKRQDIRLLTFAAEQGPRGRIELTSGDHVNGRILNNELTIRMKMGQNLKIPVSKLQSLEMHAIPESP